MKKPARVSWSANTKMAGTRKKCSADSRSKKTNKSDETPGEKKREEKRQQHQQVPVLREAYIAYSSSRRRTEAASATRVSKKTETKLGRSQSAEQR